MGKAKITLPAWEPTLSTGKRNDIGSRGSVGSRTWSNAASAGRPVHRILEANSQLADWTTSLLFESNDRLELSSTEAVATTDAWMMVFAFTDLDTSAANTLVGLEPAVLSEHGYFKIGSGGTSIVYHPCDTRAGGDATVALNNTDNSSINYTFGSDVEVLIIYHPGSGTSSTQYYYNIDGDLIGKSPVHAKWSTAFELQYIGGEEDGSDFLEAELLDFRFYTGSDIPPTTAASLAAIGNRYKQHKN